ncbi:MAG: helix-turn-helix domain-containing protein, partial [Spirulina sp. SIO3F2]|nr:helix-turn-helix domain-containing protein [Spirulina sp. SIO3F2]
MTGVYRLEIKESVEELKGLLRRQKTGAEKERIQWLYLLKSEQAQTMEQVAQMLGRHRVTVQKWAKKYREGGLEGLLKQKPRTGRPSQLPNWAEKALAKRLQEEDGFNTYHEIG